MADIILNKLIPGTTLVPISREKGGMLRCICSVCGKGSPESDLIVNMMYKESYLKANQQECRYCAYLKKLDTEQRLGKKNTVDILMMKEIQIKRGHSEIIKPNGSYFTKEPNSKIPNFCYPSSPLGDLKVLGYIGKYNVHCDCDTPNLIALRCPICQYTKVSPIVGVKARNNTCPNCSEQIAAVALESQKRIKEKTKRVENKVEKIKIKEFNKPFIRKSQYKDTVRNKEAFADYIKSVENLNPDCTILDVIKQGSGYITKMRCNKCGTLLSISNTNKSKTKECDGCEKRRHNLNYKGILFRDYEHTVFNMLEIISQDFDKCTVKCTCCGKTHERLDLYGVISRQYVCDCEMSSPEVYCTSCNCILDSFSMEDIANSKCGATCKDCGKSYTSTFYQNEVKITDDNMSLRRKLQSYDNKSIKSIKAKLVGNSLIQEANPVYAGTDGEYYYRCRCTEHNVDLILSSTEIENYSHEYCEDARHKMISEPNADKMKL